MAYKKGEEIALKWNAKLLLGKLSGGFEGSTDAIDTTNDDSAGFKSSMPGDIGGTVSFSAVYDPAALAGQGCDDLEADWLSKAVHPLIYGGTAIGDKIKTCSAYITKIGESAKHADKVTCDVTFQITGPIVKSAITV
ncbi:MAG: hypothetical protein NTX38_00080 [Methylobacter sp.]|nr:hypothetical protein [Methylobacter sp.]